MDGRRAQQRPLGNGNPQPLRRGHPGRTTHPLPRLQAFGYPCNWKKNEKLTIRITYTPSGNGFALELWLDGRYGSGFYEEVGRRGYKDMGTDFDEELTAYAKLLKKELNEYLLKYL